MNENKNTSSKAWVDPEDAPELSQHFFLHGQKMIHRKKVSLNTFKNTVNQLNLKSSEKKTIHINLSTDVLAYFKATGDDWKNQLDQVLKEYVIAHK